MQPWHRGGTMANLGLAWGWRTLSPQWQGLWGGDTPDFLPYDYGQSYRDKAVVWDVQVTLRNCTTGAALVSFPAMRNNFV